MKRIAYREYKNTGMEWPERLPKGWDVSWLKWSCRLETIKAQRTATDEPYLGLENVESWTGRLLQEEEHQPTGDCLRFGDHHVLFGKLRPYLAKVAMPSFSGRCTGEFLVLKPITLNRSYLFRYLTTPEFIARVDGSTYGAKMPRADWRFIGHMPVPLPPLPEQRHIADFLDRETDKIDRLIAEKEKLIALLEEKRKAVISQAVTKGLNPHVKLRDSQIPWLGMIPEHWKIAPLYARYKVQLGKMLDKKRIAGDHLLPYLRNQDVQWGAVNIVDLPEMDIFPIERTRYTLKDGDLLVCEGGEVGRTAIWKGTDNAIGFQKALHRLRAVAKTDYAQYFYYVMYWAAKSGVFISNGSSSTIDHLTAEQLRRFRFAFPPPSEQLAIALKLNELNRVIMDLQKGIKSAIALLRERRAALISAAVTGQLDVRGAAE